MEEKRGKNGCIHFHVWVESEEGTMQFMKWLVFGFLVFMISVGVAWAGEQGYRFVAGKDSKLCARVLKLFVRMWTINGGCDTSTRPFGRLPGGRSS